MDEELARSDPHVDEATHAERPLDPDVLATRAFYFTMALVVLLIAACVLLPIVLPA